MRWLNRSPVQGGWHCGLSWNRRDGRHGGYGRGMPPLRKGCAQDPRLCLRDGAGSSRLGVAHHRERSVFGSVLVLGEPLDITLEGASPRSRGICVPTQVRRSGL
jgi:hypothetical protein